VADALDAPAARARGLARLSGLLRNAPGRAERLIGLDAEACRSEAVRIAESLGVATIEDFLLV
jgi:hypothetical protein